MKPFATALALLLLLAPFAAHAQEDATLAEALFQDARRLMTAKKYDEACPKFEESQRLAPKLGTLLNLATCHDKQGKTGSAWGEYTKAISLAKESGETERVDYARQALEALEPRLTKLVVEVPEPVTGIEVLIDDRAIGKAAWRTPIPLDPGKHEVIARAPGYATWSESITVEAGPATQTVRVPPLAATGDAFATIDDDEGGGLSGMSIAGIVVGLVGVGAIGAGSYFGVETLNKQSDSEDHCDGTLCDQEGVDLREDGQTSATVSTVLFAVGLAAVGTGVTLLILGASDSDDEAEATIRIHPLIGGLGVEGRW
jgi:hypothetical protein